jgi:hypothetical protein
VDDNAEQIDVDPSKLVFWGNKKRLHRIPMQADVIIVEIPIQRPAPPRIMRYIINMKEDTVVGIKPKVNAVILIRIVRVSKKIPSSNERGSIMIANPIKPIRNPLNIGTIFDHLFGML